MSYYTQEQLNQRSKIIQSQKLFWKHLDKYTINNLINLFDMKDKNSDDKITKYIEKERTEKGLDISNVIIKSELDGERNGEKDKEKDREITLHLRINKDDKDLLHLSIHLSPQSFRPQDTGVIHIVKNIYSIHHPSALSKKVLKKLKAALITVHEPIDKPNSLEFAIGDGYTTSSELLNTDIYDPILQQEMDVILTVLNRLFDEDNKEYYIGNKDKLVPIHAKINAVLENMNKHNRHVTRKNRGSTMLPLITITNTYKLKYRPSQKTIRRRNKNTSRLKQYKLPFRYTKKHYPK